MWSGSAWTPATSSATGQALTWNPPPLSMYCYNSSLGEWVPADSSCFGGGGGGSGTVISFSAGTLSPLFTTSVATSTTTPALTFSLSNAAANTVFGNFTGGPAGPTFSASPTFAITNLTGACTACTANTATLSTTSPAGTNTTAIATTAFVQTATTCATEWITAGTAGTRAAALGPPANQTRIWSFTAPCSMSFTKITISIGTADNTSNLYDVGIYNATGSTLICHTGATAGTTFAPANNATVTLSASCALSIGVRIHVQV